MIRCIYCFLLAIVLLTGNLTVVTAQSVPSKHQFLGAYKGTWEKMGTAHKGEMCFEIKKGPVGYIASVVVIDSDSARTRYTWISDVKLSENDAGKVRMVIEARGFNRIDAYAIEGNGTLKGEYAIDNKPWGRANLQRGACDL